MIMPKEEEPPVITLKRKRIEEEKNLETWKGEVIVVRFVPFMWPADGIFDFGAAAAVARRRRMSSRQPILDHRKKIINLKCFVKERTVKES